MIYKILFEYYRHVFFKLLLSGTCWQSDDCLLQTLGVVEHPVRTNEIF